jgi:MYXO-CTERM domain-containing protein
MAVVVSVAFAWSTGARADTIVDGGDLGGQVWTAENGPYVVTEVNGPPVVSQGTELRIEPGVTVLFAGSTGSFLEVAGSLKVLGTTSAPVVLQAASGGTETLWQGVRVGFQGGGSVEIADAVFRNASYGVFINDGQALINRTTFENCRYGVSVSLNDGHYSFDSLIFRNNVVGFECDFCGTVSLTNVLAVGHTSRAVILHGMGNLSITNATIDGGGQSNGVDIWPSARRAGELSAVQIVNSVLSNNRTAIELDLVSSRATLVTTYSTFWGSGSANLRTKSSNAETRVVDVPVSEAPPGAGNVVADPKYVSDSDLHLSPNSPCIDSGTAEGAPDHDLEQSLRPFESDDAEDTNGSTFDRGAYEYRTGGEAGNGAGGAAGGDSTPPPSDGGVADSAAAGSSDGGVAGSDRAAAGGNRGGTVGGSGEHTAGAENNAGGNAPTGTGGTFGGSATLPDAGALDAAENRGCGCLVTPDSTGTVVPAITLAVLGLLRRRRKA